jgi:hypothetical protein
MRAARPTMRKFLGTALPLAPFAAMLFICAAANARGSIQDRMPAPTGPYAVGRSQFIWKDDTERDRRGANGGRAIAVWVWYPASPKSGAEPAAWMPGKWGALFWADFLKHYPDAAHLGRTHPVRSIRTHAYANAPVVGSKKFPLLIFAPGKGDLPLEYSTLIEDVVSHGYIVAGILPTSGSGFTVLSSGRVVLDQSARMFIRPGKDFEAQMAAMQAAIERSVHLWSADMIFVLNRLQRLNEGAASPLAGHFDFTRVGTFGHSQGGAASLQTAKDDPRVRAVFDLDGMMTEDVAHRGLPKPVAIMNSDTIPVQAMARNPLMSYDSVLRTAKPGYHLRLAGSVHFFESDYGLLPFLPPSARPHPATPPMTPGQFTMPLVGTIDPVRALTITEAYVEAFFGQYLKGRASPLLNGPSPDYPEISFEKFGG